MHHFGKNILRKEIYIIKRRADNILQLELQSWDGRMGKVKESKYILFSREESIETAHSSG
jgi:hypothetical protein